MITDHEILRAMFFASDKSGQELEGAHATVCMLDADKLERNLLDLAGKNKVNKQELHKMAGDIADTKVMKVGHVRDFIMKLSFGDQPLHVKRMLISEIFGPVGFNIHPSLNKAMADIRDAARLIPYLGFGDADTLFAPDVIAEFSQAMGFDNISAAPQGTMLVIDRKGERRPVTAYDFFIDDPYLPSSIKDYDALKEFQHFLRHNPVSTSMRQNLSDFFDAPVTVGFRDVLRFIEGSRHPNISWDDASQIIQTAFEHHGYENFIPREINYYTYWVNLSHDEVKRRRHANKVAASAFSHILVKRLPLTWTMQLTDAELAQMALELLDAHFSYPNYEVEPSVGIFSTTSLKIALRLAFFLPVYLLNLDLPARRNPANEFTLAGASVIQRFLQGLNRSKREEFLLTVNQMLWETDVRGGVMNGHDILPFQPVETTFYSIQDKAQSIKESGEIVLENTTLEDIVEGNTSGYLDKYPDLSEKLLIFFTLIYRYFLDTDFIPDLRPDKAGTDMFIKGIWGYKSKNLVITGKQKGKDKRTGVMFIDNKDQFKQYQRTQDRNLPIGMAKYAMRMVSTLIEPAMLRSIGIFAWKSKTDNYMHTRLGTIKSATAFGVRYIAHVTRSTADGTLEATKALLEDIIDDTRDGILRILGSGKGDK